MLDDLLDIFSGLIIYSVSMNSTVEPRLSGAQLSMAWLSGA